MKFVLENKSVKVLFSRLKIYFFSLSKFVINLYPVYYVFSLAFFNIKHYAISKS